MTTATLPDQSVQTKRVFAYGRASLGRQQLTLPAQEQNCKHWFDFQKKINPSQKWQWCGWFPDPAVSSKFDFVERPAGQLLLERARPGDTIVVARFDRAFRSISDYLDVIERLSANQVHFEALDMPGIDPSTPTGKCVQSILAAVKQLEKDEIKRRTSDVLQWKRSLGLPCGGATPIGWKKRRVHGKNLSPKASVYVIDPYMRKIGAYIVELHDVHKIGWWRIKKILKNEGITDPRWRPKHRTGSDGPWPTTTIQRIYNLHKAGYPLPGGITKPCTEAQLRQLVSRENVSSHASRQSSREAQP